MAQTHIVFLGAPSWGHIRPFCIFAARLVNENPNIIITMLLDPKFLDKAIAELAVEWGDEGGAPEDVRRRARALSAFKSDSDNLIEIMKILAVSTGPVYKALAQSEPITCAVKGTVFEAAPPPTVVIADFFAIPLIAIVRATTGQSVPILAWITGHASSRLALWAPESLGGLGDPDAKTNAEAARLGITPEEVGTKYFFPAEGKVRKIPGVPAMYDYEFYPQKRILDIPIAMLWRGINKLLHDSDGAFIVSSYDFEPESIDAFKSWLGSLNKDAYALGPLLPLNYGTVPYQPGAGGEFGAFLDKMLTEHGKHSVVFMSFGTVFWPASPEYMEVVIDGLIEKKFPFIFCFASPLAKVSDELAEKVKASGIGMLTKWSPQQFILNHPATGWFLSHCGQNSVLESLGSGIPIIAWPFDGDQPGAAAHLQEDLNVAIELIEVRTGEHGLKPRYKDGRAAKGTKEAVAAEIGEVLDICRGPKGEELRKNAQAMKAKFAASWKADGVNRKEIAKFLEKYGRS